VKQLNGTGGWAIAQPKFGTKNSCKSLYNDNEKEGKMMLVWKQDERRQRKTIGLVIAVMAVGLLVSAIALPQEDKSMTEIEISIIDRDTQNSIQHSCAEIIADKDTKIQHSGIEIIVGNKKIIVCETNNEGLIIFQISNNTSFKIRTLTPSGLTNRGYLSIMIPFKVIDGIVEFDILDSWQQDYVNQSVNITREERGDKVVFKINFELISFTRFLKEIRKK
jgi:hypothetical protein